MTFFRVFRLAALSSLLALLSACSGTGGGPYNTSADGADGRLMLKGHDPVAYFTEGRHVPGKTEIKSEHDGVVYRFASEEHRAMFSRDPAKYVPQFGGYCSNGIAYGIPWGGDPDTWRLIDGKLYIFGGESSRRYFLMDEKQNLALAERYWRDEVKGGNAVVQRVKRLVFRVPHYQTGKELEDAWQRSQR